MKITGKLLIGEILKTYLWQKIIFFFLILRNKSHQKYLYYIFTNVARCKLGNKKKEQKKPLNAYFNFNYLSLACLVSTYVLFYLKYMANR